MRRRQRRLGEDEVEIDRKASQPITLIQSGVPPASGARQWSSTTLEWQPRAR